MIASAENPPGGIVGCIDEIQSGWISGWCADTAVPGRRLELDLLVDGQVVARVVADRFRADLVSAGIGDGAHGFGLTTPDRLFDGEAHRVELRELSTGVQLPGAAGAWQGARPLDVGIGLEGSALLGWARMQQDAPARLRIEIVEDGRRVCGGVAFVDPKRPELLSYRVPLPPQCFDGRLRRFAVRGYDPTLALGELETVTPFLMPHDAQLYTGVPENPRPALQPLAALRYQALSAALESVRGAGLEPPAFQARTEQLLRAHALLVRSPAAPLPDAPSYLAFPEHAAPRVSVVIPVHNQYPVTLHCLAALLLAPLATGFEVILVDDGSIDQTRSIAERITGISYLRNETAEGFIRACNRGAAVARGEFVVMLNNDTEVTSGWLDELLRPFAHFDRVGLTGAKLLYPDGRLQEAGGLVWDTGDPLNYGRNANPHDPRYSYARQIDYASGACIALPRALWQELGGFDEQYCPAYFEDTDLAFRVRERGYRTVFAPLARVVHYEGVSSGTSTESGAKRFQEINRPRFKARWVGAGACLHHGHPADSTDLHKDRGIAWRALVLDTETPRPDQSAGSHAAIQELRMLQALGFKCTFVPANLAWMGRYTEDLQRMGVECVYAPFTDSIEAFIETRGVEFDLVYITRHHVAASCLDALRRHAPRARVLLMLADLHFLRELRAAQHAGDALAMCGAFRTRAAELAVIARVDLTLSYTEEERAVVAANGGDASRVAICPWVTAVSGSVPPYAARRDIAFLGGFNHPPNSEAVRWFVAEVMPGLREALPGVCLRVYGSHLPRELAELGEQCADVRMEGWVPDLATVFDACRVFVAPLQSGAGIKGKVIGALAHGLPCVLSPLAAEGIPVRDGVEAGIATTPAAWVEAIVALYTDGVRWEAMSAAARTTAERHFGFDAGVERMRGVLQQAGLYTAARSTALLAR